MWTLFYRLPRLSVIFVLMVLAGGIGAILTLGRQEDPTLVERYGTVLITLPGADAERMEALILEPLEQQLMELAEIDRLFTTARNNSAQVRIEMREDLTEAEIDDGWTLIRAAVDEAESQFPEGTLPPFIERLYVGAATLVAGVVWDGDGPPEMAVMTRLAEDLEDRFQSLGGTEETQVYGLPQEEIQIVLDQDALAAAGLDTVTAARAISAADAKVPAGTVRSGTTKLNLELAGGFDTIARIRDVPLVQRDDGTAIRVGDVADVRKGLSDPVKRYNFTNGQRTVMVAAFIQPNQRVDQWADRGRAIIAEAAAAAPPGVRIETLFDQSRYTETRLGDLASNLAFSALIVFVVLFLIMGWRSALVIGMALPLTVCLVLTLFRLFNMPLHQMSVTGLVISLGLLIDNAIVVVDEFDQERGRGATRLQAIDTALRQLFGPLFASTLTTALAFAPIALLPGSAGEFVGMIGVSVIFSVSTSFLLAMTVVPAMAGWFDRKRSGEGLRGTRRRWWRDGIAHDWLSDGYRWTVEANLRFPALGIVLGTVPSMVGLSLGAQLPSQFFPQTERDQFQLDILLPAEATIEETKALVRAATDDLLAREGVEMVNLTLGEPAPRVYYNAVNNTRGVEGFAAGWVRTESPEVTRRIVAEVQRDMRRMFPNAQFLALPYQQGPPVDAPIQVQIAGEDLETLDRLGDEVRAVLARTPGVTYSSSRLQIGAPQYVLRAGESEAAILGERFAGIAGSLSADLDGILAGSVLEGTEELPVRVLTPEAFDGGLADLKAKRFGQGLASGLTGDGMGTPLSALGDVVVEPSTSVIIRRNGERITDITAYLEPYTLPAPVFADFQSRLEASGFELPEGYDFIVSGDAEASGDARADLAATAVPLLLIMAGAVALVFNSFRMAALILVSGGLCVGLAFFGVWLFNLPLGFNAILGALGLLGIAINGSIVVLSMLRADPDCLADDVIAQRETIVDATRHIVATTLTTMGGFVPLLLAGDAFWMPLAAGIFGGVAGSAILALYFTPAVFRLMTMRPISRFLRAMGVLAGGQRTRAAE